LQSEIILALSSQIDNVRLSGKQSNKTAATLNTTATCRLSITLTNTELAYPIGASSSPV